MESRTMLKAIATVLALVLAMTACGGGDDTAEDVEATADVAEEPSPDDTTEDTDDAAAEPTDDDGTEDDEGDDPAADASRALADEGSTAEPCPAAVNPDNGCIYLGSMSDLTVGPFSAQGPQIVQATEAFWQRVNADGGIGGYDIDTTTYSRDHQYSPEVATQVFREISNDILAISHLLGSPMGIAVEPFLEDESVLAIPGTWTSEWLFSPNILESGSTYCVDGMNSVDYAIEEGADLQTVMAIHYPGDFGDDAAAGVEAAAEANGLEYLDVTTLPGAENQGEAVSVLTQSDPDLVLLAVAPGDLGTIVGNAVAQGFEGAFFAQGPGFNEGLLDSPVADTIQERVIFGLAWNTVASDAPGVTAFREAMGDNATTTAFSGWAWSYPLLAVMRAAAEAGDMTRAGLIAAAETVTSVDYEGILPEDAGNISGEANDAAVRTTTFARLDADAEYLATELATAYTGPTAEAYDFQAACYR